MSDSIVDVPPSVLDGAQVSTVVVPSDEYLELRRKYNNAAKLAAFVSGVLSVGKFDKKTAQLISAKCAEFYPS